LRTASKFISKTRHDLLPLSTCLQCTLHVSNQSHAPVSSTLKLEEQKLLFSTNQGLPFFLYVEPTSGANQSFTFLSTPAVPKINAGAPPEGTNRQ
jgi:hypothetical protein